jgi:tetratricopeptide (TPR) repeat protein
MAMHRSGLFLIAFLLTAASWFAAMPPQQHSWAECILVGREYYRQSQYGKAEAQFLEALRKSRESGESQSVALTLTDLACLYQREDRYLEAERFFRQALEIDQKLLSADDSELAAAYSNLGAIYQITGKYDLAAPLHERALAIHEKRFGSNNAAVALDLANIGALKHLQARYSESESNYCRAIGILEGGPKPFDVRLAQLDSNLATLY